MSLGLEVEYVEFLNAINATAKKKLLIWELPFIAF
jgi:hypothetical protein